MDAIIFLFEIEKRESTNEFNIHKVYSLSIDFINMIIKHLFPEKFGCK